jgi:adenine-specific DNA-methyltransferase
VLRLNAEEDSKRRFILVSSNEATGDAPDKNLCRDVCAERVRLVMQGYTNNKGEVVEGVGGSFAYLRTKRIPASRVFNDMQHEQVWRALQLIHGAPLTGYDQGVLVQLSGNADDRLVYVPKLSEAVLDEVARLASLGGRLVVYSWQTGQIRQRVEAPNVAFEKIPEFLVSRFGGGK